MNELSHKKALHFVTPGDLAAGAFTRLTVDGPLRNIPPAGAAGVGTSAEAIEAWRRKLRTLQAGDVGRVVNLLSGGVLAGGIIGALRHGGKLTDTKTQLDAIEHKKPTDPVITADMTKSALWDASTVLKGIADFFLLPARLARDAVRGAQTMDARTAGPGDTSLGWAPKGWTIPVGLTAALGGALVAERAVDKYTDVERDRMIKERKTKLEGQFNRLLSTPTPQVKQSEADAGAALLDVLADNYARFSEKSATSQESMALGMMYTWMLASGILAYRQGAAFRNKRDPGTIERKALERQAVQHRLAQPVSLRFVPETARRVSPYAPHPVRFPAPKSGEPPEASGADDDDGAKAVAVKESLFGVDVPGVQMPDWKSIGARIGKLKPVEGLVDGFVGSQAGRYVGEFKADPTKFLQKRVGLDEATSKSIGDFAKQPGAMADTMRGMNFTRQLGGVANSISNFATQAIDAFRNNFPNATAAMGRGKQYVSDMYSKMFGDKKPVVDVTGQPPAAPAT